MEKLRWCIYYSDGTKFSNLNGSFKDAPSFGVLAILCDKSEAILGGDFTGLIDYLCRIGIVKFGRMVDNQTYNKITDPVLKNPHPELGYERVVNVGNDYYWWVGGSDD